MKDNLKIINLNFNPVVPLLLMFVLIMPALSFAALEEFYSATDKIFTSVDGAGSTDISGHSIIVKKPSAAATVRKAFLMVSLNDISIANDEFDGSDNIAELINGAVQLEDQPIIWDLCTAPITFEKLSSCLTDVTALVKPTIDALPAGDHNFIVTESKSIRESADGEVLVVVFNDPTMIKDQTTLLMHGAQSTLVEENFANIAFAEPINPSDSDALADMGVGIGFGRQDLKAFTDNIATYSQINVKGTSLTSQTVGLLTSSAGGQDDGGGLFTVGGLEDTNTNPIDSSKRPNGDFRLDDELYSILPFLSPLDTGFQVSSKNPSIDDILFFAYFNLSTAAAINPGVLLSPLTATNPVRTEHTVTAKVLDDEGNPISDRNVTFNVIAGPNTGKTGSGTSDPQGEAIFTYTDMAGPGTDKIQASLLNLNSSENPEASNIVDKIWCEPNGIVLSPDTATNLVRTEHTMTAKVIDDNCSPLSIAEREVTFTVIAGPNSGTTGIGITNAQGEAMFSYTDTLGPGTDQIIASFLNSAGLTVASNSVESIWRGEEIVLSPETAKTLVGTDHTVTAMVIDNNRNPIADRVVTFNIIDGPNTGKTGTGTSDVPQGEVIFTYTDTEGPGTDQIQASFLNSAGNVVKSKIVEKLWFNEGLALFPETAENPTSTNHTLTAILTDDNRNPIADRVVTFTVIAGPNIDKTGTGITNNQGEAIFTYTDMAGPGSDEIQAAFLNSAKKTDFSNSVENNWRGPDRIMLSPTSATSEVRTDHTLMALINDENRIPIAGREVTFTVISGPNTGKTGTVTSDTQGNAIFTYTDSAGPGTDKILASFRDFAGKIVMSPMVEKEWTLIGLDPNRIILSPDTAANLTGTEHTVTAMVLDVNDNPIAGHDVTFTVITGPNTGKTGTSPSDTLGNAIFTYTDSAGPGTDQIQVSSLNSLGITITSEIVESTWLALPIERILLSPDTVSNPTDTIVTVTAMLADDSPIAGSEVSFTVIAGPNKGKQGTNISNTQGESSFTYTNMGGAGTDQIQASFLNSTGDRVVSNPIQIIWPPTRCFVDDDSKITQNDIKLIFDARGEKASGINDPRDANGDGTITVNDSRACVLQCTLPACQ